ncbi:MAG: hypothetical protein KY445_12005, partial [Armatimonadetes bacterium]|nr:hypothetical protein [Armatimonadota bacterium]
MKRISLLLAAMFLCGVAVQRDALPQPLPELAPVAPERPRQRMIRVKNVSPTLIAWWIDPNNNPTPLQFSLSGKNEDRASLTGAILSDAMKPSGVMLLPAGIQRVVAIDAQNSLLVFGTEAGTKELERVV